MKRRGWFITKSQDGERTLEEQMKGLAPLLAAVRGKRVADLGCAEGLIAIEVAKAGAQIVYGVEVNRSHVEIAAGLVNGHAIEVHHLDLNERPALECVRGFAPDVTLMLAVLHKLHHPGKALAFLANATRELAVIRLPHGSSGHIESKHCRATRCNGNDIMLDAGFRLEAVEAGPREEKVQYWRRQA